MQTSDGSDKDPKVFLRGYAPVALDHRSLGWSEKNQAERDRKNVM